MHTIKNNLKLAVGELCVGFVFSSYLVGLQVHMFKNNNAKSLQHSEGDGLAAVYKVNRNGHTFVFVCTITCV